MHQISVVVNLIEFRDGAQWISHQDCVFKVIGDADTIFNNYDNTAKIFVNYGTLIVYKRVNLKFLMLVPFENHHIVDVRVCYLL
jgi:hypothetical protein